ncbi:MAG: PDGLE domain-containing protein [Candidatus Hodarchaeota archaeon]
MILGYKEKTLIGIAVLLGILLILVPFASSEIDGLEKVAEEQLEEGKLETAWEDAEKLGEDVAGLAPFTDYSAIFDGNLGALFSGIIGIILILGLFGGFALVSKYRRQEEDAG